MNIDKHFRGHWLYNSRLLLKEGYLIRARTAYEGVRVVEKSAQYNHVDREIELLSGVIPQTIEFGSPEWNVQTTSL